MFEFLKNIFDNRGRNKENTSKPLIVCIHGFGKRRDDEYKNFIEEFSDEHEIVVPRLFDQENVDDTNWDDWVKRAEEPVLSNKDRDIILVGYSMGGVIASFIAVRNSNVKKLILLEPAFEWMNRKTVTTTATKAIWKTPDEYPEYVGLPRVFFTTFMDVVGKCRKSISQITCPVVFIHCLEDELIPWTVSRNAYKKCGSSEKKLFILGDGRHRVMDDPQTKELVFDLFRLYGLNEK